MIHQQAIALNAINTEESSTGNLNINQQPHLTNMIFPKNCSNISPTFCNYGDINPNSCQTFNMQVKSRPIFLNQLKYFDKNSQFANKKPIKTQIKKMFTNEEDQKLINAVEKLRYQKGFCWTQVSEIVGGGRTPRQCRERYKHYLDPEIKNPKWTIEEEILLEQKYAEYGPRWSIISKFFKSRTDVNVKNHWTILSQRIQKLLQVQQHHQI